jgi:hypothetical protein
MRRTWAIWALAALGLAGCDQSKPTNAAKQQEPDHWAVIPVTTAGTAAIWRVNTNTGSLEYCWRIDVVRCDPPFPAAKQLSSEDAEALSWAEAHPSDPRAAKIKQVLGIHSDVTPSPGWGKATVVPDNPDGITPEQARAELERRRAARGEKK